MNARKNFLAFTVTAMLAACGPGSNNTSGDASDAATNSEAASTNEAGMMDASNPSMDASMMSGDSATDARSDARSDGAGDGAPEPTFCRGGSDGGTDAGGNFDPPGVYTFVVRELLIDANTDPRMQHSGFNLDGRASDTTDMEGCGKEDYYAHSDSDQNVPAGCVIGGANCRGGVDNRLPTLINRFERDFGGEIDVRGSTRAQINRGLVALLVRVTGVENLMNDDRVTVQIMRAYPAFSSPCTTVLPDRTYQIAASSLREGGTGPDDAIFSINGRIVNGRLQAEAGPADVLAFPVPGLVAGDLNLRVRDLRIRFDISASGGAEGNLGGRVDANELRAEFVRLVPALRILIETNISEEIDLRVAGVCVDNTMNPPKYGHLSMGTYFSLYRARIASTCTVTNRPQPGTCGEPPQMPRDM